MIRYRVLCVFILFFAAYGEAKSQQSQREYFRLVNRNDEPIWLTMRGHDQHGRIKPWIPYMKIPPGGTGIVRLVSYQPFDIYVYHPSGQSLRFDNVNLCSMMRECATTGRWSFQLEGNRLCPRLVAEERVGADGRRFIVHRKVYETCCRGPGCPEPFHARANRNNVTLPDILFPPQNPPIDDPYDPDESDNSGGDGSNDK
jgi:hypothetical protein